MPPTEVNPQLCEILVGLAEGFPNVRLREGTFRAYEVGLQGLTLDQIRVAATRALRECQFFPSAAELRRFAEPTTDEAGLIAWSAFQQAASSVGSWGSLLVDDEAAAHAFQAVFGSWAAYCEMDHITWAARKQEFLAAYRQGRRLHPWPGHQVMLTGHTERGHGRILAHGEFLSPGKIALIARVQARLTP